MNTYFNENIFPNQYKNQQPINQYIEPIKKYTQPITNIEYIKEILKNNNGKKIRIYMSFPNINEQKEIKGIIEQSGEEYITLSNPTTGEWYILPKIFINYITFEENINYN